MTALLVAGGMALLAAGAEGLVRGARGLALGFGVSPLAIGLTVVAVGTSSPELAVSVEAGLRGNSGIALGNVIGSNISNVLLVLGVSALVRPLTVRAEVLRRAIPVMIACSLWLCACVADGVVGRLDGLLLTSAAGAYLYLAFRWGRRPARAEVISEFAAAYAGPPRPLWQNACLSAAGLGLLFLGAALLLRGVVTLALLWGVSELVVGLTMVAVGTSLPELASSAVAAAKGEGDIVLGNAVGSNALNILLVLGLTALVRPIPTAGVRAADLGALLASAVLLYPMARRGHRLDRVKGAILLLAYALYLSTLLP